jgi:hypothetical protein
MELRLLIFVIVSLTSFQSHSANADSSAPIFLVSSTGCKFVSPFGKELPTQLDWTGECIDGLISGPGEVTIDGPIRMLFRGEFERGQIAQGVAEAPSGTYEGPFENNLPHGKGVLRGPTGKITKGTFYRGNILGDFVEFEYPSGVRYEGQINPKTKKYEGKGILRSDLFTYEGMFRDDHPEGAGVMTFVTGEVRRGDFVGGHLSGKGWISWPDGAEYEGEVRMSQPHGRGRCEFGNGDVFEGDFVAGDVQGKGKMMYSRKDAYEGDFIAGAPHGRGLYKFANGDEYEGEFISGKRHGQGRLTFASGLIQEGQWKDDQLYGKCRIADAREIYEGECADTQYSGYGHLERPATKEVYDGEFLAGHYDGKGSFRNADYKYEGTFKKGVKHGAGKEVLPDGSEYDGGFLQDLRHGRGVLKGKTDDGIDIVYEGEFAQGMLEGAGTLSIGSAKFSGEFREDIFVRGTAFGHDGRTFELDLEKGETYEILPDGSKRPVDGLQTEPKI